jgi:hypothetical protein
VRESPEELGHRFESAPTIVPYIDDESTQRGGGAQLRDFASTWSAASGWKAGSTTYTPPAVLLTVACLGSPTRIANPQHRLRVRHSATPLLLANARHDPITGYNWATDVAHQLGREGVLLTYEGWGHGVYGRSACVTGAIDRYLINRTFPTGGAHCPPVEPSAGVPEPTAQASPSTDARQFPY